MFGGIGGALKSVTDKAGEMMEKTKQQVGEMAAEKKAAAQAMLENQAKKTGDIFSNVKGEATSAANEAQQQAIDGFDAELANAEKTVESSINEVGTVVDEKMKEADKMIDEKREEAVKTVQDETTKVSSSASEGISSMLGKAKGLLNF